MNLWIANEESSYRRWTDRAETLVKESALTETNDELARTAAISTLADELKDAHTEEMPEVTGVYSDLLTAALQSVDWHEVAADLAGDVKIDRD